MLVEYIVLAIYLIALVVNLIVNKNKPSLIKGILGVLLGLTYLLFYYIDILKPYMWAFDGYVLLYMSYILITMIPKRITNTITEYDYVEVEKAYRGIKDEHEVLRERFVSTISLIEEGVVFYEDNFKEVFLSDKLKRYLVEIEVLILKNTFYQSLFKIEVIIFKLLNIYLKDITNIKLNIELKKVTKGSGLRREVTSLMYQERRLLSQL